ncbi:hypothetical protein ACFUIT_33265 [Streptomyces sp. NPDC057239]|uniref:hypothetical protein n=1 Tax=Streptomyces sp. NPDC057239 TaxID=3346061 RepID=UPI0036331998
MLAPIYTPSLPGLSTADEVDTVINWGLGADSTAYFARMLTDPAAHGIRSGAHRRAVHGHRQLNSSQVTLGR